MRGSRMPRAGSRAKPKAEVSQAWLDYAASLHGLHQDDYELLEPSRWDLLQAQLRDLADQESVVDPD